MTLIVRNVSEELHRRLKILAIEEGTGLNKLVLAILKDYADRYIMEKPFFKEEARKIMAEWKLNNSNDKPE